MPRRKQNRNPKAGHRYYRPYSENKEPETAPSSWGKRLAQDDFDRVAKPSPGGQLYTVTDAAGVYGTANLPYPKKEAAAELTQQHLKEDGQTVGTKQMKLFHQGKLSNMWGICWRQTLKCKNCRYEGGMYNLYAQVPSTLQVKDAGSNFSVDGQYNSMVIASRRKAGRNASQAVGTAIEQQTAKRKIVTAYMESKLCWTSLWLRNRDFEVDCPGENEGCTATLS